MSRFSEFIMYDGQNIIFIKKKRIGFLSSIFKYTKEEILITELTKEEVLDYACRGFVNPTHLSFLHREDAKWVCDAHSEIMKELDMEPTLWIGSHYIKDYC